MSNANFTIGSKELKEAISFVGDAVPQKSTIPVLENVLFTFKDNELTLMGSDTEITAIVTLGCNASGDGSFLLPQKKIREILGTSESGEIKIGILKKNIMIVLPDKSKFSFGIEDPESYVLAPKMKKEHDEIIFNHNPFQEHYSTLGSFRGSDELKVIFNHFGLTQKPAMLVCSDGGSLGAVSVSIEGSLSKDYLIGSKFAKMLSKIKLKEDEKLVMHLDGNIIHTEIGGYSIFSSQYNEKIPPYTSIIPSKKECSSFSISGEELKRAIKKGSIVSDIGTFNLTDEVTHVMATSELFSEATKIPIQITTEEKDLWDFNVSLKYLDRISKLIDAKEFTFYFKKDKPNSGIRVSSSEKPQINCLFMPLAK